MRDIIKLSCLDATERLLRLGVFLISISLLFKAAKIEATIGSHFLEWAPVALPTLMMFWLVVALTLKNSFSQPKEFASNYLNVAFRSRINQGISFKNLIYALSSLIQFTGIFFSIILVGQYFFSLIVLSTVLIYFFIFIFSDWLCKFFYQFGSRPSQFIFFMTIIAFLFPFILTETISANFLTLFLLYGIRFSTAHFITLLILATTLSKNKFNTLRV